jgi:hypothetical protein
MATISIPPDLLNCITQADDDRVIRALEAVHSGSMTVNYRVDGDQITAHVSSRVWKGKKIPRCEEHEYRVVLGPGPFAVCSCPDHEYRPDKGPCKHILTTVFALDEGQCGELKKAA